MLPKNIIRYINKLNLKKIATSIMTFSMQTKLSAAKMFSHRLVSLVSAAVKSARQQIPALVNTVKHMPPTHEELTVEEFQSLFQSPPD